MSFSEKISRKILEKSKRHCGLCYKFCGRDIELHHIIPIKEGGKNSLENCIQLCFNCHSHVGHYNVDHPKGKKIRPGELKFYRDQLFGLIKEGKISSVESEKNHTNLVQARIEMDEFNCIWDRPKNTQSKIDLVFHEKALFRWSPEKLEKEKRTIDPIFDITLINPMEFPITLNRVGIRLIDFWQKLKGISSSKKIKQTHFFEINLKSLKEEPEQFLKLRDPIFIPSQSPYRFSLLLKNYHSAVPANCIVITIIFDTSKGNFESDPILLGSF